MEKYKNQPIRLSSLDLEQMPIKEQIIEIIEIIRTQYCVLIAGGAVRDLLLGQPSKDIDLCTNATPDELIALMECHQIKVKPVGQAFGVVIAMFKNEDDEYEEIEIATFRTDGQYSDGRRPDSVSFVRNPAEDAVRRDLTINGIFYDPFDDTVIDYVGGIEDMKFGILRFIGNPVDRINEDKLRMLRYVRFLRKTGFQSDEASSKAIRENAHLITSVSAERIKEELEKMFAIGPVSEILQLLKDVGLLKHILPEVDALSECEQGPPYHMEGDVFVHTCMLADNLPDDTSDELRWAAILHDIGKPATRQEDGRGNVSFINHDKIGADMANSICRRLKFPNHKRKRIVWLIKNHIRVLSLTKMRNARAKRFVYNEKLTDINPYFEDLLLLAEADESSAVPINQEIHFEDATVEDIKERYEELISGAKEKDIPKLITGYDVMQALALKTGGPKVGQTLRQIQDTLFEEVPENHTRERALEILTEIIS